MKFEIKTKALRFLSDIQTGPFGSQLHKENYVDDGTPIVTVEHLGNRVFTEQNLPRVSNEDKQRLSKYILKEGDIVFSRVGSVDRLIAITKELAETLRKNRTIDWNRREQARARMRMLIKRLLKKHKYPPEGMDDAVQTVMTQCELWTDNMEE